MFGAGPRGRWPALWKAPMKDVTTPIGKRLAGTIQEWRLWNHAYAGTIKRSCFSERRLPEIPLMSMFRRPGRRR